MATPPACAVLVVSYDSAALLPECLAGIRAQTGVACEVWVVDNASHDGSPELVRRDFPEAHLVANPENVGFARANNQVLLASPAEAFALVNPDAVLPPGALRACLDHLLAHPDVAVVGTRLVYADGRAQDSCHRFLSLGGLAAEVLALDRWLGPDANWSWRRVPGFRPDRAAEVDWLQGAFLVVRGRAVREVGGFDPDFFMYGEEMEWCYRLRRAGWKVAYLPEPPVVHLGGATVRPVAAAMFVENLKGHLRFFRKHRGALETLAARLLIGGSVLARWAVRESAALGLRLIGRPVPEGLRHRREIFRAAAGWVLRGQPLAR